MSSGRAVVVHGNKLFTIMMFGFDINAFFFIETTQEHGSDNGRKTS